MNQLIVVLSGPIAAGKSTLCDGLVGQFGFSVFKTRELIQELLKNVPSERAALQKAGETLDRRTNGDWVAASLARKIQEKGKKCHVIVDSVRIKKQIDGLRRAFGSRVVHIWIVSNRKQALRKGKVQLVDASSFWQKMRKSLGSKRKELGDEHIADITRIFAAFEEVTRYDEASKTNVPISRIFPNEVFGYRTITVERPLRDESGKAVLGTKGKLKGLPQPDADLRDTENVPLSEDVESYFKREVLPHAADAWIDHEKTKAGYEIPFNRHFYVYKPPRPLAEIDADLKLVTDRILVMLGGLAE